MIEVDVKITVQYRSDGHVDRARVQEAIAEAVLKFDRPMLFANGATYAGYSVSLEPPKRKRR
jgi:predicted RND superfamily exporter protein